MAKASIHDRLEKLENHQRFLVWFVSARFYATLTVEELEIFARDGQLPDPLPSRPSPLDGVDRKTLTRRWKEEEQIFGGRSPEDLEYYAKNGIWPEQRGRLHYSMEDGKLFAEWRRGPEEEDTGPRTTIHAEGT